MKKLLAGAFTVFSILSTASTAGATQNHDEPKFVEVPVCSLDGQVVILTFNRKGDGSLVPGKSYIQPEATCDTTGPQGPAGPQGGVGPAGPQGERGWDGATGKKGDTGPAGKDGINGLNGTNGRDAVQHNCVTPDGYLYSTSACVPLPVGLQGPQGVAGPQGPAGANGTSASPAEAPTAAPTAETPAGELAYTGSNDWLLFTGLLLAAAGAAVLLFRRFAR